MKGRMVIGILFATALMFNVGSAANVTKTEKEQVVVIDNEQSFDLAADSVVYIVNDNYTDFQPVMIAPEMLIVKDVVLEKSTAYKLGKLKNKVYYQWLLHRKKLC